MSHTVEILDTPEVQPSKSGKIRKKVAGIAIFASVAVGAPHVAENWDELWGKGLGYGIAYGTFTALYSAGGIAKLGSVFKRRFLSSNADPETEMSEKNKIEEGLAAEAEELQPVADDSALKLPSVDATQAELTRGRSLKRENLYLIANGVGAVGMGVTAAAATVALLPPVSWPVPLAAATADVGLTIWSRRELLHPQTPVMPQALESTQ